MRPTELGARRRCGGLVVLAVVALAAEPARADEVVVEGRAAHSPRDPTAASTVIPRERLERPGAGAADLLETAPGVEVQRTGAASDLATASLRGATSAQTPVYLAGVRLNDDVTGTADLSTVPLSILDRIEVFRGNAPEHADQLGPGGAVFLEPRLPGDPEARGGVLLGSFGARSLWLSAGFGAPASAGLFAVRRDAAENDYSYVDDGGTRFDANDDLRVVRQNADFVSYDAWAIGRHRLGTGGRLVTVLEAFEREQGVTGIGARPALRARARTQRELLALSSAVPCRAGVRLQACRVELVTSALRAESAIEDPAFELSLASDSVSSSGLRVGQRARVSFEPAASVTLALGLEESLERLRVLRRQMQGSFDVHARREETRATASSRWEVGRMLTLFGLGALERRCVEAIDARCDEPEPTGRLGGVLTLLPWLDLLGNVSATSRAPLLGELYGVAPLVRGNPELRPERAAGADLGFRANAAKGRARGALEAFAFRRSSRDLIAYTASFRQTVPYNVGRARFTGLEVAASGELHPLLRVEMALTLLDPRDATSGRTLVNDVLPYHARAAFSGRAELGVEPWPSRLDRLALALGAHHRASRYADRAGLIVVPAETSVNVEALAELIARRLAARVVLDDVFDAADWDLVGAPLPGRTLYASIEARIP